ncbi:alpha/beta hydrolase [Fontibacillus sp. BL9]|uniref:alpha/beta hydrolase n=1 Tax=Fontibacillus sp. BL9 TaxID=3389971 RepID=UPI00397AD341
MKLFQELLIGTREVLLYLPPSYEQGDRQYPVAYVQDGGFQFTGCIRYLEHLFATRQLSELILVGIQTEHRNDEYTPWPADSVAKEGKGFGGNGRQYVDEIADVLKPYIDKHYRTRKEAKHTAMIGGSLGGLISWFAGHWRPEVFGRIGMLSASLWYEGVMEYMKHSEGLKKDFRVYLSVGGCEGKYKSNAQSGMVRYNEELYAHMKEQGFPADRLTFVLEPDATHDDLFMIKRFPEALQRLFDPVPEIPVPVKSDSGGFHVPGTESWRMVARNTGREYRIHVSVPQGPPPVEGYPVLYSLDANASFGILAESMRMQSRGPHGIPAAVIVGIGYDSPDFFVTGERFRDYTVFAETSELPDRPGGSAWPDTGGADDFLDFIELQLKPAVEQRVAINRSKQALFGHSLGGFLSLYAMLSRKGTFQRFIAASPSIWWKNKMLFQLWDEVMEEFRNNGRIAELLVIVGTEEKESMITDAGEFIGKLRQTDTSLFAEFRKIEGEGHVSVIPSLISPLLRFVTK